MVDGEHWWSALARKREAADALLLDQEGRVLVVQNAWDGQWSLPGGGLDHDEAPRAGAEREIAEELGLAITAGPLLVVDWEPPTAALPIGGLMCLFDGGVLDEAAIASIRRQEAEVEQVRFVHPDELPGQLPALMCRRIRAGLTARLTGAPVYLEGGVPPRHG